MSTCLLILSLLFPHPPAITQTGISADDIGARYPGIERMFAKFEAEFLAQNRTIAIAPVAAERLRLVLQQLPEPSFK